MPKAWFLSLAMALAPAFAGQSDAALITFNQGAGVIISQSAAGEIFEYSEAGMLATSLAGPPFHFHIYLDRAEQFDDGRGVRFSLIGGGAFDLLQLTLGPNSDIGPPPGPPADFFSSSGAMLTAPQGLVVFPSAGWTGITSFTWHGLNSVDNIEFRVVPDRRSWRSSCLGLADPCVAHGKRSEIGRNNSVAAQPLASRVTIATDVGPVWEQSLGSRSGMDEPVLSHNSADPL